MKLIFDCGSTKCAVGVLKDSGDADEVVMFDCGFNACVHQSSQLENLLDMLGAKMCEGATNVSEVSFYGAGCREGEPVEMVKKTLANRFDGAEIAVASDMLGAARAVCGRRPGIVGILGTGSNSCHYDGKEITANVSPLGYILGDEGSGAVLGKLFLGRLFKGGFPKEIRARFDSEMGTDISEVIESVYRGSAPNRYLASFAPFILRCSDVEAVHDFLTGEFRRYIRCNLAQYQDFHALEVGFVGSISFYFKEFLMEAMAAEGGRVGVIVKDPISSLMAFHRGVQV